MFNVFLINQAIITSSPLFKLRRGARCFLFTVPSSPFCSPSVEFFMLFFQGCCSGLCEVCIFFHRWLHRVKLSHSFRAACSVCVFFLIKNWPIFPAANEKKKKNRPLAGFSFFLFYWVTCTAIAFMHECFDSSTKELFLILSKYLPT